SLRPHETAALMNSYFSRMSRCVFSEGGTLVKFIGDAVFAIWGAPVPMRDHAARACAAALAMARASEGSDLAAAPEASRGAAARRAPGGARTPAPEPPSAGWGTRAPAPPLVTRIGVHTGSMLVGNLGSEERFDYTAIGDAVNAASRLEGLNKPFGTTVL